MSRGFILPIMHYNACYKGLDRQYATDFCIIVPDDRYPASHCVVLAVRHAFAKLPAPRTRDVDVKGFAATSAHGRSATAWAWCWPVSGRGSASSSPPIRASTS